MQVWKVTYRLDESSKCSTCKKYLYVTKQNKSIDPPSVKAGVSGLKKPYDENQVEDITIKLRRYSTAIPDDWKPFAQIPINANSYKMLKDVEQQFFDCIELCGGVRIDGKELFSGISNASLIQAIEMFVDSNGGKNKVKVIYFSDSPDLKERERCNNMKNKYTKKQIEESIKHWKRVLERMNENDTIHDDQVSEDTHLVLEVPGTDGADINIKGDWDAVRFAVDMMTDALNHMKSKDPVNYKAVSLHVR